MKNIIELQDLSISYGKHLALEALSLKIPKGQIIGIIGPNGTGKTSLLKAIMGIVPSPSGKILIDGKSSKTQLHRMSYVPQRESIDWTFPASVMDVVLMGRYSKKSLFRRSSRLDKEKAIEAIHLVGLNDLRKRQIGQLSGGQQQRCLVARSLAKDADIFLLDEPFAGVDANTEKTILNIFDSMKSEGKTIILVHHDLYTAQQYFDHIVLLKNKLIAEGPTEEVMTQEVLSKAYGGLLSFKRER